MIRHFASALALLWLLAACAAPRAPSAPPTPGATPAPSAPAAGGPTAAAADARAVESFYRGKTVRFVTGFSAGGSFDNYTRAIARHVAKHIPGNPATIVDNVTGAGGLIATNQVYNVAPKDGTVVLNLDGGVILLQALERPGIEFDARRFVWLPSPGPDVQICWVTAQSGWGSLSEAAGSQRPLILGATGPGSFPANNARILQAALGLNLNLIDGYPGIAQVRLAAEQGEVEGACHAYESIKRAQADQLASGEVKIVAQVAEKPWPGLERVPNALDLARTDDARRLLRTGIVAPNDVNRLFALPPGVPAERVAALRQAFRATFDDPDFNAELNKSSLDLYPISVARIGEVVDLWLGLSAEQKAELREILKL
jgi:tripartite-type tricarboxylate transporter receptor subunit TctC